MANPREMLQWSFIASLVGSILILVGGLWMLVMMAFMFGFMPWGMMGGFEAFGMMAALMSIAWLVALAAGIAGLVAAFKIRREPERAGSWGVVAIVAGAMSLFGFGGGMIGAAALIVGGVLAVSAAQRQPQPQPPKQPF